jgi:two-component system, NarL family, sensor kinase
MPFRCCLFFLLSFIGNQVFSQDYSREALKKLSADSLKSLAESRENLPLDTTQVRIFSILGSKCLYADNIAAKEYALKTILLAKKIDFKDGLAAGRNNLAMISLAEGDANNAYRQLKINQGYYIRENNVYQLGLNFLNIGVIHGSQKEYNKAIDCFNKAIYYFTKANAENTKLAGCYSMIGNAYSCLKDEKRSIRNYHKALALETDENDIGNILNNIGKAFADFKKYDSAMYYYRKALVQNEKIKSPYNKMTSLSFMGDLYLQTNQPEKAVEYLKKGLIFSEKEKHLENKIAANKNLSEAYRQLGDFKTALGYHLNYAILKDSLNTTSSIDEVRKIEAKFELERQDAKLVLLESQKKLNEAELRKSKAIMILGAAVLLLFIMLTWYWYSRHKTKIKLNLQQKEQFKTELKLREAESTLEGQLLERKRLAQELHDGLAATLAGIKLETITYFSERGEENKSLVSSLNNVCNDVRLMSHNLIPPEFSKETFEQIMKKLVQNYSAQTQTKLHLNIDGAKDLERMDIKQKALLYRILQETVTNAFKHAKCSDISLLLTTFNDYINIIIEDNGVGFDPSESSEGIGLKNIRERIKDLGSQLTIDSSVGNGTVIQFAIPINQ